MASADPETMIRDLFVPQLAAALLQAKPSARTSILQRALSDSFAAQPAYSREHAAARLHLPLTDVERSQADDLAAGRIPLADGSSIDAEDPFPWYTAGRGDKMGPNSPVMIVERIAFSDIMLRAWNATGDAQYLDRLYALVMDYFGRFFVDSGELPEGDNWLCTSCRCGWWAWTRFGGVHAVLRDPASLARFSFDDLVVVFRGVDNMMTGLVPALALGGNWRVHELQNVFTQGFAYPFLQKSAYWRDLAVASLNEEFDIQFRDDGSHEELCIHYGNGTWSVFCQFYALGRQAPELGIRFSPDKMNRCAEYFVGAHKPFGMEACWGDAYAPRTDDRLSRDAPPVGNAEPIRWDPLIRSCAGALRGVDGLPALDFVNGGEAPGWQSRYYKISGHLVMRDGWENESLYANLNMGYYDGCHTHYNLLGIEVAGLGREFILDPGVSALDSRPINANMQRTRAHSVMTVDDLDQNVRARAETSRLFLGGDYDFAVGVYRGGWTIDNAYGPGCTRAGRYTEAFSGDHFRHMLFVKKGYWILFDALATHPGHTAQTRFQFLPGSMRQLPGGGVATGFAESNLAILPLHWDGWNHELLEGCEDPIEGWLPGTRGSLVPAPLLKGSRATDEAPCWHGSLLFPYREAELPPIEIAPMEVGPAGFGYRLRTDAWTDYVFMSNSWNPRPIVMDAIETDAACLHLRLRDGVVAQAFACEGSYLRAAGLDLFNTPGTMLAREFRVDREGTVACNSGNPRKAGR